MRLFLLAALLLTSFASRAVPIDIPGYNFAATVGQASFTGSFFSVPIGAETAITDPSTTSYVYSGSNPAYIDMAFSDGSNTVTLADGDGIDLSVFLVDSAPHLFTLSLFEGGGLLGSQSFDSTSHSPVTYTGACVDRNGDNMCLDKDPDDYPIWALDIDFATFGIGDAAVDTIRMELPGLSAVPSLLGAYNLHAGNSAVVPLPLPALLFISGLGVLGFFGRRKPGSH